MGLATYECVPCLGWGLRGRATAGVRREAHRLGLELAPLPWAKLHELVAEVPFKVTGERAAVEEFEAYMRRHGYEARAESHIQDADPAAPAAAS